MVCRGETDTTFWEKIRRSRVDRRAKRKTGIYKSLPINRLECGVSAVVEDVHTRVDQDVTIVVRGEFGRMPKIGKNAGREHWARVRAAGELVDHRSGSCG
jgi:hypothetical protein